MSSAQGIAALVREIHNAPIEPGMASAPVLIVCPPPARDAMGPIAAKFQGAKERSVGLADAYREVSRTLGCSFFDAGSVTDSSRVDGIHLDADQHLVLGSAMANEVEMILFGKLHQNQFKAKNLRQ